MIKLRTAVIITIELSENILINYMDDESFQKAYDTHNENTVYWTIFW